jgi:bacillithiol biosynthesis cysteine-adding enzyme BshC
MSYNSATSPVHPCRSIRFTDVPRTSALFADYVYAPERLERFYAHRWEGVDSLARIAPAVASAAGDRNRLADALVEQNRRFGASELAIEHIELLRRPDSVAVVTGQQAGLFGGPLFTVHKALSAILLASRLRERGIQAVPVFWVASEDHDFEEVNHVTVPGRAGSLETIRTEPCGHEADRPVGSVSLCAEISRTVDAFMAALPDTVFAERIRRDLMTAYAPGSGFAEAFARLLARLFADYGVVLLDPLAPAFKELASPTYARAVERAPEIAAALVARSGELVEAGYHAQVFTSPDMMSLFVMENGHRRAMVQRDGRFELKSGERSYDRAELLALAEDCPECLSPNVTLRPVVQDTILPTVAYVGGPAEVAYFAQIQPVYDIVGRPMPVIVPRTGATLVDRASAKTLEKYEICLEDLFEGHEVVLRKVVERSLDAPTAALFGEIETRLEEDLERLRHQLETADPSLAVALRGAQRKMLYQLNKLRTRFVRSSAEHDEQLRRRLAQAEALLYPEKGLQERTLNVWYYIALAGHGLIDDLARSIDPENRDHQLVDLGGVAAQVFTNGFRAVP